jgi:hypothetical protein
MSCPHPKLASNRQGIYSMALPPFHFIAAPVQLVMMDTAERHREFVAHLHGEPALLGKGQMVRVRRLPAADHARLVGHLQQMVSIAQAPFGSDRQGRLVDARPRSDPRFL